MNEAKLKKLLAIFQENDIEELELQYSFWRGTRIRISRRLGTGSSTRPETVVSAIDRPDALPPSQAAPSLTEPSPAAPPAESLHVIAAPMVGTFFRSPSPEAEAFVDVGDRVKVGQVVCIIEAMKIMNEIAADVEGEVIEVLAGNADPVEFNQPLLKIRPL